MNSITSGDKNTPSVHKNKPSEDKIKLGIPCTIAALGIITVFIVAFVVWCSKRNRSCFQLNNRPPPGAITSYAASTSKSELKLLTVCTASDVRSDNFEATASYFGYDYSIIGKGLTWQGWAWRTLQYIKAIESLPDSFNVIMICDCTDVLLCAPREEALYKFENSQAKVLIGGEPVCLNEVLNFPMQRAKAVEKALGPVLKQKYYKYPNGGALIGYREDLLNLLRANVHEADDQTGYQKYFAAGWPGFEIDVDCKIIGNLITAERFFKSTQRDTWTCSNGRFTSTLTGERPCLLHFAGMNWKSYNAFGTQIQRDHPKIKFTKVPDSFLAVMGQILNKL